MPVHDWTRVYAGLFHDFHQSWSIRIKDAMNGGMLPDGLTALVEQKSGPKESDVLTVDAFAPRPTDDSPGGLLTAAPPATRFVQKSSKEFYSTRANRIVVKHNLGRTIAEYAHLDEFFFNPPDPRIEILVISVPLSV